MKNDTAFDQVLRGSVPAPAAPPALHASIMRAVQTAGPPLPPMHKPSVARWLAAPAVALLLGAVWAWHSASVAPRQVALDSAGIALAKGADMARSAPDAALAPLNDEWQRVNLDLHNTAQFVLAALPNLSP
jgi:hypothetical protein